MKSHARRKTDKKIVVRNTVAETITKTITRDHSDMSTQDIAYRMGLRRQKIAAMEQDEAQHVIDLAELRAALRVTREEAAALDAIIESRR